MSTIDSTRRDDAELWDDLLQLADSVEDDTAEPVAVRYRYWLIPLGLTGLTGLVGLVWSRLHDVNVNQPVGGFGLFTGLDLAASLMSLLAIMAFAALVAAIAATIGGRRAGLYAGTVFALLPTTARFVARPDPLEASTLTPDVTIAGVAVVALIVGLTVASRLPRQPTYIRIGLPIIAFVLVIGLAFSQPGVAPDVVLYLSPGWALLAGLGLARLRPPQVWSFLALIALLALPAMLNVDAGINSAIWQSATT